MRKTWTLLLQVCCAALFLLPPLPSDAHNRDSLLHQISATRNKPERLRLMYYLLDDPGDHQLKKTLYYHQKLLALTRSEGDKAGEAVVTGMMGYAVSLTGNMTAGTDLLFNALALAEKSGSQQAIGMVYAALGYVFEDRPKKKTYLQKALAASTAANDHLFRCYALGNLSYHYLIQNQLDSALYFSQRHLELATVQRVEEAVPGALVSTGDVHYQLGQKELALAHYRAALTHPYLIQKAAASDKGAVYGAFSRFYLLEGNKDSALYYAQHHQQVVQQASFAHQVRPAYMLWKVYQQYSNADSALKYATLYYAMKDSMYSIGKVQHMQALALLEEARQLKQSEERVHNLQYAGISLGLVAILIGFLVLSHSVVANPKLIKFLGVVLLLIVFEFLNLLLHPGLGSITHHSPILMLLAMVCVAALLVPLHHRLEHWITHRLVEKNNRIRLAAAKRTIQQLEGGTETVVVGQGSGAEQPH